MPDFTFKQIMPADGWQAVHVYPLWHEDSASVMPEVVVSPLVGWALAEVDQPEGQDTLVYMGKQLVVGLVSIAGGGIQAVGHDAGSFLGYCPSDSDPERMYAREAKDAIWQLIVDDEERVNRWAKRRAGLVAPDVADVPDDPWGFRETREIPAMPHPGEAEAPTLDAYSSAAGWEVYCDHCHRWHKHGHGAGHRVAHCDANSPYKRTGYVLRLAGEMTDEIRKAIPEDQGERADPRDLPASLHNRGLDIAMLLWPVSESEADILIAHARREGSPTDVNMAVRVKELLNEVQGLLHEIGDAPPPQGAQP
jgi:hypothetical protein